jgi:hypothetical protein
VSEPLIERQRKLLAYLTSADAIFDGVPPGDPELAGFDGGRLRLEARFSFGKRIDKIRALLPVTFALLGESGDSIVRDFTVACPPVSIARIDNAVEFCDFLRERERGDSLVPAPPWLTDIAACELAFARVRMGIGPRGAPDAPPGTPRLARNVVLLRCRYNVAAFFEEGPSASAPERRETLLAVQLSAPASQPRVFALTADAYALLNALADARPVSQDPAAAEFAAYRGELVACGLIEFGA